MLFWRRLFSSALAFALLLAISPLSAPAADHRDSPTADGSPEGDITDFFTFLDSNDASQIVMIVN